MDKLQKGSIIRNKAGRDKEGIFIVLRQEEEYLYLADGHSRTIQKPKKKKYKHVQLLNKYGCFVIDEASRDIESENARIRKEIKRIQEMEGIDV